MKKTKKLAIIVASLVVGTSMAAFTACDTTPHVHNYTNWTVTTPPTCENDGVETGTCPDDKETSTRPVDKLGHDYDAWKVVEKPTATQAGSISKTCKRDATHVVTEALPKLSEVSAYKSVVAGTEPNTAVYTYTHEGQDITFTASAEKLTTEKAVEIALANMTEVTDGELTSTSKMGNSPEATSKTEFAYGDDYMHIKDEGNLTSYNGEVEMHISKMEKDGETEYFFPFVNQGDVLNGVDALELDLDKIYANGLPLTLMYAEHPLTQGVTFYGAGSLLSTLYEIGKTDANGDFVENVTENQDGTYTYTFSFGYKGSSYGYQSEGYFRIYKVTFKLDSRYVLKEATVSNTGYANKTMDPATGEVTGEDSNFITDDDGHTTLTADAAPLYSSVISIVHNELTDEDETPANPYKYEDFFINSFDVTLDGKKIENGATVDFTATTAQFFKLENISPSTFNTHFDSIKIYTKDEEGKLEECDFMYPSEDYHIKVFYREKDDDGNPAHSITINPYIAGDSVLVIKTENLEFELNLHTAPIAPASNSFKTSVFVYDDVADAASWSAVANQKVYVGQELKFTTSVLHPAYEDAGYTVKVMKGETDVTSTCVKDGFANGVEVSVFTANEAGDYSVILTNTTDSERTLTLNVSVAEAPEVSGIFKGEYNNAANATKVTFTPSAEGALNGTAQIVMGEDDAAVTTTVNYTVGADRKVTAEYVSGAETYDYSFILTDSYKLILAYKNDRGVEKKMLLLADGVVEDNISGTYELTGNDDSVIVHTATDTATYELTFSASLGDIQWFYTGYVILDGNGEQIGNFNMISAESTEILLNEGESLKVYSIMEPDAGVSYTLARKVTVDATSITLDKTAAEMTVGGDTLELVATINPEDATNKKVVWSSSDTNIATVDANGVVTAVGAGTAVITATTANGLSTSCTVTVTFVHTQSISVALEDKDGEAVDFAQGATLLYGNYFTYELTAAPDNASDKTAVVTSSDDSIISVSDGKLVAKGEGTATVTFKSGDTDCAQTITVSITVVMVHVTGVTLDKTAADVYCGGTATLTPVFTPENASEKGGVWTSSDTAVATVNKDGVVTGVKVGTATITFTSIDGNKTATCTVTVKMRELAVGANDAFDAVSNQYNPLILKGAKANTKYTFSLSGYSRYQFYGAKADGSYDPDVYKTSGSLTLTADANGEVLVYVRVLKGNATVSVTVTEIISLTGVTLPATASVGLGGTLTLTPVFTPANASDKSGGWTSSDSGIIEVYDGTIYVNGAGTATVTFTSTDGEFTASCEVTVTETFAVLGDNTIACKKGVAILSFVGNPNSAYKVTTANAELGLAKADKTGSMMGSDYANSSLEIYTDKDGKAWFIVNNMNKTDSSESVKVEAVAFDEVTELDKDYGITGATWDDLKVFKLTVAEGQTLSVVFDQQEASVIISTSLDVNGPTYDDVVEDYDRITEGTYFIGLSLGWFASGDSASFKVVEYQEPVLDLPEVTEFDTPYGSDTEADGEVPLVYILTVAEGDTVSVVAIGNSFPQLSKKYDGEMFEEDYSLDKDNLTAGTYYIGLFSDWGSTSAWFKVVKK